MAQYNTTPEPERQARALAATIRDDLAAAGISHRQAATLANLPETTVRRRLTIDGALSPLNADEIARLAGVLGTTPAQLWLRSAGRAKSAA